MCCYYCREIRNCLKLDPDHKQCFPHYKVSGGGGGERGRGCSERCPPLSVCLYSNKGINNLSVYNLRAQCIIIVYVA